MVAMAMLVVGLIQALLDFGASTALMRKADVSKDEIDSAWTLRLLESLAMGVILLAVAPIAARYFDEPRVLYVLWVLALCVAFAGATNIGFVLAQKEFKFAIEFKLQVISKSLGVATTIIAGYLLRDYRALTIGIATGYTSATVLSYLLHPYRPRWNTSQFGEIWAVTKWLMLAGIGGFIMRKGDELIAARIGSTAEYGVYNVGADLGQMPTGEVGPAMLRALLPVLTAIRGGAEEINAAIIKTVSAVNTITFPIGLGFAAVATPACSLILGASWTSAAQYVAAFALLGTAQIIQGPFSTLLTLHGHTSVQSKAVWLEFAVFLVAAIALVPTFFLSGLVWARMVSTFVNLAFTLLSVKRQCDVSMRAVAFALARPLIGAVLMNLAVQQVTAALEGDLAKLSVGILTGALTFSLWSFCTWWATGKPAGLESTVMAYFEKRPKTA